MKIETLHHVNARLLECQSEITAIDDALELVTACFEQGTEGLLLESRVLPESFFDLRTRFAGEFVQKLQNYGVRTAAVFPSSRAYNERFEEFLVEAKRGRTFRAFTARAEALNWLAAQ